MLGVYGGRRRSRWNVQPGPAAETPEPERMRAVGAARLVAVFASLVAGIAVVVTWSSVALGQGVAPDEERRVDPRSPEVRAAVHHILDARRRGLSRSGDAPDPTSRVREVRAALQALQKATPGDPTRGDDLKNLRRLRGELSARDRPTGAPARKNTQKTREVRLDAALMRLEDRIASLLRAPAGERARLASELLRDMSAPHARRLDVRTSETRRDDRPARQGKTVYTPQELEAALRAKSEASGQ